MSPDAVRVRVLLFARYRDAVGQDELELTLEGDRTAGGVVERIRALAGDTVVPPAPLIAVNRVHVGADAVLREGDEVAILPPLAGG